jgi:GH18 family chitinase
MWAWDDMAETKPNPFSKATVSGLKQQYPELKVLAAFGGWNLDFGFADNAASGTMLPLAERIVKFRADNGL